ncbi:MAG: NAD(P)/FAD-dependent oxidoreductase [Francisellaceae bacterium]
MKFDVIIIGAGASGLMCAIEAAKRGRRVCVIDHANKAGKKILMSGGGRCNFTNYYIEADRYLSSNRHFCKSALTRFTQWDFIAMVERHGIDYHEKTLGQLFCDGKSQLIVDMLLREIKKQGVTLMLSMAVDRVEKQDDGRFRLKTIHENFDTNALVIASGGLSIPTMGASGFGYQIARQFDIKVLPTRAGLVPFTLSEPDKLKFSSLSGISIEAELSNSHISFRENVLFTHRGISGPAVLQISSYWREGETVMVRLLPQVPLFDRLVEAGENEPVKQLKTILCQFLPKRVVEVFVEENLLSRKLADIAQLTLKEVADVFQNWRLKPAGSEGYRTAEVTLGGVDPNELSSKTMMAKNVEGLYFIGEVVDVTGWLGGYNFQWAWASGWACGQVV